MCSETADWIEKWLNAVAAGSGTMSQRKLSSFEKRGGGLATAKRLAEQRGLYLLVLEDEEGDEFLVASVKPFRVIC
jgi:hypothetical protein